MTKRRERSTPAEANGAARPAASNTHVVIHTHWDREWYMTFEGYRSHLIELMDHLLSIMDPASAQHVPEFSFMFDDQVAPIDDYLELRPEEAPRVARAVRAGSLQIGPSYTLADQFVVSGETTLRNLQLGMKRAEELGETLSEGGQRVAYFPDQFGMMAQLPQVLRHVGIGCAVVARGVPAHRLTRQRFNWRGIDGSTVDTLYLQTGYHLSHIAQDPQRFAAWKAEMLRRNPGDPILLLAGGDHLIENADLPRRARLLGGRISSLSRFWRDFAPAEPGMQELEGELRSPSDDFVFNPNVVSGRVDQRILTAEAERELERYAEPLAAFAMPHHPSGELDLAWRRLIQNAAHDSACATSIDDVVDEVKVRARGARDLARGVRERALGELSRRMQQPGLYVWNPSNFARDIEVASPVADQVLIATKVPPLGWARVTTSKIHQPIYDVPAPQFRLVDEPEVGDVYTWDPGPGGETEVQLPVAVSQRPTEPFKRLHIEWENRTTDHRLRLRIKLPQPADHTVADTSFGAVTRPAVPEVIQGKDRLNGYPASKFIVAGGVAVMVDRCAEFELLPETNELAITLVRSSGALSRTTTTFRPGPDAPIVPTPGAQVQGTISWDIAVMPWTDATRLPWNEWEQFMLPAPLFLSDGGGDLPESGTAFPALPEGVLSAVLPGRVRTFDGSAPWKIHETAMTPELPAGTVRRGRQRRERPSPPAVPGYAEPPAPPATGEAGGGIEL